jgi:hypothetical protein
MWQLIFSIVIVIIIIIFTVVAIASMIGIARFTAYYKNHVNIRYPKKLYSIYEENLKDGDIILFANRTHTGISSVFTNTLWTHSGVVVRQNGKLFISESTFGNYIDDDGKSTEFEPGSQLSDFNWRCKEYPGQIFIMPLKKDLTRKQIKLLNKYIHTETKYPDSFKELVNHIIKKNRSKKSRHCMQHTLWLLEKIGITPCKGAKCLEKFSTGLFSTANNIDTLKGADIGNDNTYMPVFELVYDNL